MSADVAIPDSSPRRKGFTRGALAFGPGLVLAVGTIGARDLVTNSISGAAYGYSMIWLLAVALATRFVILEASARYVIVTGRTMIDGCGEVSRWMVWLYFVVSVLRRVFNGATYLVLIGAAVHLLFPLPVARSTAIWSAVFWVIGFLVMFWGRYRMVETICRPLAVVLGLSIAVAALLSRPDPVAVGRGLFIPSLPESDGVFSLVVVIMGVVSAATGSFSNINYSTFVHEKGWRRLEFLRRQRVDLFLSIAGSFLALSLIQIAAAGALRPLGIQVEAVEDIVPVFSSVLGEAGRVIFSACLWSIVFTSYIGSTTGYAMTMADVYHRYIRPAGDESLFEKGSSHLPAYRWLLLWFCAAPLGVLAISTEPVWLVLFTSLVGVFLLPIVIVIILRLTADRRIMKAHANGWLINTVLVLSALSCFVLAIQSAGELL